MVGAVTATCLGVALIAVVAHDVFDALFHHRGAGILSGAVMRATWWGFRRAGVRRRSLLPLAGPFALVAIVALWLVLLVTGWALVLWPHIIDAFRFDPGAASGEATLVDAVYVSLVTLATLGFGDITPAAGWLKVVLPLEALIGLGLLTATVSWLLSIHPALSRRRSLAYEISLLRRAEGDLRVFALGDAVGEGALSELTSRLVAVERDLTAWPIAYYFAEADERFSLPSRCPTCSTWRLAELRPSWPRAFGCAPRCSLTRSTTSRRRPPPDRARSTAATPSPSFAATRVTISSRIADRDSPAATWSRSLHARGCAGPRTRIAKVAALPGPGR